MPTQALPNNLPLVWDLALPLGPALVAVLLVVAVVGLLLTLSARAAAEQGGRRSAAAASRRVASLAPVPRSERSKEQPIAA